MRTKRTIENLGSLNKKALAKFEPFLAEVEKVMASKGVTVEVISGLRSWAAQAALFAQGRTKPGIKVTNIDGVTKKSKHNHSPSQAVDIAPWVNGAIPWNDNKKFDEMAKIVLECAKKLGIKIIWGADWDSDGNITEHKLIDRPHFEI